MYIIQAYKCHLHNNVNYISYKLGISKTRFSFNSRFNLIVLQPVLFSCELVLLHMYMDTGYTKCYLVMEPLTFETSEIEFFKFNARALGIVCS